MTRYVALLRGVNVGGHRRLTMAALRESFAALGHRRVSTYIQSGNVLFEADGADPSDLRSAIEGRLRSDFGHEIAVILRDRASLERVVRDPLFAEDELGDEFRRYVIFLASAPDPEATAELLRRQTDGERFRAREREVYQAVRRDVTRPGAAVPVERILRTAGTSRNWTVVQKLHELLAGMD